MKIKILSTLIIGAFTINSVFAADKTEDKKASDPVVVKNPGLHSAIPPEPPGVNPEVVKKLRDESLTSEDLKNKREDYINRKKQINPLTTDEAIAHTNDGLDALKALQYRAVPSANFRDITWSIGSPAPVINMSPGFGVTIVFVDAMGNPLLYKEQGAVIGDKKAIEVSTVDNNAVLSVIKSWRSTNLISFLEGVPVPVTLTLTSEYDPLKVPVDYMVRIRVLDSVSSNMVNKADKQNMDVLIQLSNGVPISTANLGFLQTISLEKADPSDRLNWTQVTGNIAQFRVGPEGNTYVVLKPGFKLHNTPILGMMTGADKSTGYIVGGNNPRLFTISDQNGALYRITVQR